MRVRAQLHEALIQRWGRLREWLDESRHDIRHQRLLATVAAEWISNDRDTSYLLHGSRLAQSEDWAEETDVALTKDESDYLHTSITEQQHEEERERERQQRELKTQRRAANRLRYLVVGLVVFLVVAIGLSVFAFDALSTSQKERDKAQRQADVNHSLVLANEAVQEFESGFDTLGLRLALEAVNMDQPPPEAISVLSNIAFNIGTRAILQEQGNMIKTVAFSPDSKTALSGSCAKLIQDRCTEGEIALWNIDTSSELRRIKGHSDWVNSAVFSPDGSTILSASGDSTLILWDAETGAILRQFEGHAGAVNSVVFLPDGKTAISGGEDTTLFEWDMQTGVILRSFEGHTDAITTLALSPDGQILASGSADTTIIVWNLETGEPIHLLKGHTANVDGLAFRSGTNSLLSVGDISILEWNIETGELERNATSAINFSSISITPDGRTAVLTPGVGTRLWDIVQWRMTAMLSHGWATVSAGALSPDGRLALSGREDGLLYLVNMPVSSEIRRFQADNPMMSVAVSPDGRHLLTGAFRGGVAILWNAKTGEEIRRFERQADVVAVVGFSPDGQTAVLGSADYWGTTTDRKLVLVNIETGKELYQLEGHNFGPRSFAFSPDGRYLLTGSLEYGTGYEHAGGGDLIFGTWRPGS